MLPLTLAPPAPFPLIAAQATTRAFIAPGAVEVTYYLAASRGPLVIRAIAVNPYEPTIRIATVLAHDSLISEGETVSSMAQRTGAIAGINADYFDIGQTNQPLNIVVQAQTLLRTPSGRATVSFMRDRTIRFGTYTFSAKASSNKRTWEVGGINEWPPQGATAMLVGPAFGVPPATPGVTFAHIEPLGQHSAAWSANYRVLSVDHDTSSCLGCLTLAFGVNATSVGPLPQAGDELRIDAQTQPSLEGVATAVGGGPLLVKDGAPFSDPDPPSPVEALQHDPQAGVLHAKDGTLAFICVDGRARATSIGLTRPEFAALLLALGATDAMAFDSGGSATLVARAPGDRLASVQSVPSDGRERNVADGVFIYSDAPPELASRLAVRPATLTLLAGARVPITAIPTDAEGRPVEGARAALSVAIEPASLARVGPGDVVVGLREGSGALRVRRGSLEGRAPLTVVARLSRLRIDPQGPNPRQGGTVAFRAFGSAPSGEPVLVSDAVHWAASTGHISQTGEYTAGSGDAVVSASAAGRRAESTVRVGVSEAAFAGFPAQMRWQFATLPPGGPGSVGLSEPADAGPTLELSYDFSTGARAAYANAVAPLPGEPLALFVDVRGDGHGASLRASFDNADGDRIAVTLAQHVDWHGWRRCAALLPPNAVPPLRLRSLYVVTALAGAPIAASGSVGFRNLGFRFAGAAPAR